MAPRSLTKLTEPIYGTLHSWGRIFTGFLDDSLLVDKSIESCTQNIINAVILFDKLGFVVHPDKSILKPELVISYLGFQISSVSMIITLTEDRKSKIIAYCLNILDQPR